MPRGAPSPRAALRTPTANSGPGAEFPSSSSSTSPPRWITGILASSTRSPNGTMSSHSTTAASELPPARSLDTIESMADDAFAFITALGFSTVDILGFSLGGMIAQALVIEHPDLVRRPILTGRDRRVERTSTRSSGQPITTSCVPPSPARTRRNSLFFKRDGAGKRAARAFIERLDERTLDRDAKITVKAFRTQLKAIKRWGAPRLPTCRPSPSRPSSPTATTTAWSQLRSPMTCTDGSRVLQLCIYPTPGHGAIFQYHREFVSAAIQFLDS